MWGENLRNLYGELIEEVLAADNQCRLNNVRATHGMNKQTQNRV